jgi:PAS domain S-box-containing protein
MATEKPSPAETAAAPLSAADEDRLLAEAIVATVRHPLVVLGAGLRVRSANPAFYRTFGGSPEEMLNRPFHELGNGPWNIPRLRAALEDVLARNAVLTDFEVEHDFEGLGARALLLHAQALPPEGNRDRLILLTIEDVTERKRTERALRDARHYAEMIVETIREPLVVLDPNLRVTVANESFYRTFHVTPSETQGQFLYDLGSRQWDIPRLRTLLEEILPRDRSFNDFEVEHDFERLGRRTMLLNARRLDHVHLILLALEDVTERKRLEESLRESQERISAIVTSAADAILTIDERGIIESVNPATEQMFGYCAAELIGQTVNILMPSPYREEHDSYLANYLRTGQKKIIGMRREVQARRKDGTTFPVELAVSEFHVSGRRLFAGVHGDISRRKAMEREVLEIAVQEQRRIGQDLHDGTGQELIGLGLMAESLADALAEQSSPEVGLAVKIAKGLKRTLGQVRALARGLIPVEVDAQGLMAALEELTARVRERSGAKCTLACAEPVPVEDNATATQLFHIAQEAVTNALKHGEARHIRVSLDTEDHLLTLRVRDDGVGIAERQAESKGVGLRIMHYRAGLINATLNIVSVEGGGTLVTCTLHQPEAHQ